MNKKINNIGIALKWLLMVLINLQWGLQYFNYCKWKESFTGFASLPFYLKNNWKFVRILFFMNWMCTKCGKSATRSCQVTMWWHVSCSSAWHCPKGCLVVTCGCLIIRETFQLGAYRCRFFGLTINYISLSLCKSSVNYHWI